MLEPGRRAEVAAINKGSCARLERWAKRMRTSVWDSKRISISRRSRAAMAVSACSRPTPSLPVINVRVTSSLSTLRIRLGRILCVLNRPSAVRPQQALESLRRVTGLQFFEWPESLAPKGNQGREATAGEARGLACGGEAEA